MGETMNETAERRKISGDVVIKHDEFEPPLERSERGRYTPHPYS
jgi:hypothetical protein